MFRDNNQTYSVNIFMKLLLLFKNVWKFKRDLQNKRKRNSSFKESKNTERKAEEKNVNKNKRTKKRKAGDTEIQMGTYIRINIIKKRKKSKPSRKGKETIYRI